LTRDGNSPTSRWTSSNIAGALVYAITVPYAAIALTLYYFDWMFGGRRLRRRPRLQPHKAEHAHGGAAPFRDLG
jgi:hypothetical protein